MSGWTARRRKTLHDAWVMWAEKSSFSSDGHEDRFRGMLEGVEVLVESGIRESMAGLVEATIDLAAGERLGVMRDWDAREDDSPRITALREVLRGDRSLFSLRIDATSFVLRMNSQSAPERAEAAVRAMIAAWRSVDGARPYR